ncbi:hypothetical protein FLM48_00515 [Shewanella sp. Scap07]|uniref:hypothetical protein n=1 Tax=Shewanella sp. Scap07 TaxID=2589987 RepID=UPI0015BE2012|nr:hypothetical protein [Shewanella sp. Scap07]QLE83703.1 hypothetical protein FLM48_00515 [Shewanella sp. Scap07]
MNSLAPLKGMMRFWFFDVGSASFLGVALMALVMIVVAPLLAPDKINDFSIMLSMMQVSSATAVAWQLMRLDATEWANLVPDYRKNLLVQSGFIMLISSCLAMAIAQFWQIEHYLTEFLLATLLGLGFISVTRKRPATFHMSFVLFISLPFLPNLASHLQQYNGLLAVVLMTASILLYRQLSAATWHADARSVYQNGLEMGWFWLPNLGSGKLLNRLESFLHPLSYFVGPLLVMALLVLPVMTIVGAAIAAAMGSQMPVLFLFSQFICVLCAMVHWCRIQRWRGVETLYLLPGFDGKQGMIELFIRGQNRLIGIIVALMAVTAAIVAAFNSDITLLMWLHLVITTFVGSALLLGLGCLSHRVLHISLAMAVVVVYSAYLSYSMSQMSAEQHFSPWIFIDVALVLPACLTLWIGKKKLWSGDLL